MNRILNLEPNIPLPDEFYEMLIEMHRELSEAESQAVNARLILLLANHIGNLEVLKETMEIARAGGKA